MKRRKEVNQDRTKIGVGASITVKVGEINEKIREGKIRSMRKDLVGLYYLAHIAFILVIYHFWWLVLVLSMVYIWWTPVKISSENPIHVLTILFRLSVSPPSSWHLMMVWTILNSTLSVELGSGISPSLSNKSSLFLPLRLSPRKCKGVSSCPRYSTRSPPARTPLPRHTSWTASYRYFLTNFTLRRLKYFLIYVPIPSRRLIYAPFFSPWWRDWPINMLMLHSLRVRTPMASRETFPPTPSKIEICLTITKKTDLMKKKLPNLCWLKILPTVRMEILTIKWRGPVQDVPFFYTPSHVSELQSCKLIISTDFPFIFIFK